MSLRGRVTGRHWLVEFYGARRLRDPIRIRAALREAVAVSGVRLIRIQLHRFGRGCGITGVALLAESHISIHTWPERRYAALDLFMCGPSCSPQKALDSLRIHLSPTRVKVRRFQRGS